MDKKKARFSLMYFLLTLLLFIMLDAIFFSGTENSEVSYDKFKLELQDGKIDKVILVEQYIYGAYKAETTSDDSSETLKSSKKAPWNFLKDEKAQKNFFVIRLEDPQLIDDLQKSGIEFGGKIENTWLSDFFLNWIFPFILMIGIWSLILRSMNPQAMLKVGKGNETRKIEADTTSDKVTFDDVAGIEEAKAELVEIVDFLKNPQKYQKIGARIPKGVLLVGPPGTGKTFVARAVSGESGVPFFSLSGSDFVEMFVGVGASRVRELFQQAKAQAPCVIFIDEIDAIGKARSTSGMGGNEERENTLNQLLVEMDGFTSKDTVIILAATNRPEVLDRALLRPGRFDRQVQITLPDKNGRAAILKVHIKKVSADPNLNVDDIAVQTAGFSGAELANLVNESALMAARKGDNVVNKDHFFEAFERVVAGLEKKKSLINPQERKVVAYHESGHAIVGHFTPGADPVRKVSIVPRSIGALGYVLQTPTEDRFLMSRAELIGKIKGLLGGRAAEDIFFKDISTGASNDLEKVTNIVKSMIAVYGMSESAPNLSLKSQGQGNYLGQSGQMEDISEKLKEKIDQEAIEMVAQCYEETKELILNKKEDLEKMAELLLSKEVLMHEDVVEILGPSPVIQIMDSK